MSASECDDEKDPEFEPNEEGTTHEDKLREGGRRRARGKIWQYFMPYGKHHGRCNHCKKVFSCKSSTGNLKSHLRKQHPRIFAQCNMDYPVIKPWHHNNTKTAKWKSNNDKATEDGHPKFSSAVWRQFNVDEECVRCRHCGDTADASIDALKTHLEEQHSEVMDEIISSAQKGLESDNEQNADENDLFTEVVYLEEELSPSPAKSPRRSLSRVIYPPKIKQEVIPDETEVFINYLRCLLKKVPKEATAKLQLDIINVVINAQNVNNSNNSQNVVNNNSSVTHFQDSGASGVKVIALPIDSLMPRQEKMYISVPNLCVSKNDITTTCSQNNVAMSTDNGGV